MKNQQQIAKNIIELSKNGVKVYMTSAGIEAFLKLSKEDEIRVEENVG